MDRLYRSANPCVRFVHAGRLVRIVGTVPASPAGLSVLDAGCGEGGKRYVICSNPQEAQKDAQAREQILRHVEEALAHGT